jgi:nucleobase:cation symporter-1, NCS1 family
MVEEDTGGPRRKTYTPPEKNEPFTGSQPVMGESEVPMPIMPQPPQPVSMMAPPVRTSLSDTEIFRRFDDGVVGDTADMIEELERQVNLREEEEEAFQMWANLIRATRGEEADAIIRRERIIFDGGDPAILLEPELPASEPPTVVDDEGSPEPLELAEELLAHPDEQLTDHAVPAEELGSEELRSLLLDADVVAEESAVEEVVIEPEAVSHSDAIDEAFTPTEAMPVPDVGVDSAPEDEWPLSQQETPEANADVRDAVVAKSVVDRLGLAPIPEEERSQSLLSLSFVWLAALVPALGLLAGSYLVIRGLGVVEAAAALGGAGVLAAIVMAVATRASQQRGVPTLVVAGETFGTAGNRIPSFVLLLVRLAVIATLLVFAQSFVTRVVLLTGIWPLETWVLNATATAILVVLVGTLGIMGGRVLTLSLWVSAGLSVIGVALFVVLSAPALSLTSALTIWSVGPLPIVGLASLVLATLLLLFGPTSGDPTRQLTGGGSRGVFWVAGVLGVVPTILFGTYVAWASVSVPEWLPSLASDPIAVIGTLAPGWFPVPALLVLVFPLLTLAAWSLYSFGNNASVAGLGSSRLVGSTWGLFVVSAGVATLLVFDHGVAVYFPSLIFTLGVVVVAWAATFVVDQVGRTRVLEAGGGRPTHAWRPSLLVGMFAAIGLGLGLLGSTVSWLSWQGYLFPVLELVGVMDLSEAQPGVLVAAVVASLFALITRLSVDAKARRLVDA